MTACPWKHRHDIVVVKQYHYGAIFCMQLVIQNQSNMQYPGVRAGYLKVLPSG